MSREIAAKVLLNLTLRYRLLFCKKIAKTVFLNGNLKVTMVLKTLVEEYIFFSILGT
jgi:hypothetical protein